MIGNYINRSLENDLNYLQNKMKHLSVYLTEPSYLPVDFCRSGSLRERALNREVSDPVFPAQLSTYNWFYSSILIRLFWQKCPKSLFSTVKWILCTLKILLRILCLCLLTEDMERKEVFISLLRPFFLSLLV